MEDFASILVRDYGLKPQGKSAPMSSTKGSPGVGSSRGNSFGSDRKGNLSGRMSGNSSTFGGLDDGPYLSRKNGSSKMSGRSNYVGDDIFTQGNYDDVFGGPPKSTGAGPRYDDVFGEPSDAGRAPPVYDDLLGGFGANESKARTSTPSSGSPRRSDRSNFASSEPTGFDELLPGFSSEPAKSQSSGEAVASHNGDPFVSPLIDDPLISTPNSSNSAPFIDPMDVFTVPSGPAVPPINTKTDAPRASNNVSGAFDGFDIFEGYTNQSSVDASKSRESSQSSKDDLGKSYEDVNFTQSTGTTEQQSPTEETESSEKDLPTVEPTEAYNISGKSSPFFSFKSDDGMDTTGPSVSSSKGLGDEGLFSSSLDSPVPFKARSRSSPFGDMKDKWLTVDDMKLVTKPSSIPPPSRPPPVPASSRYGSRSRSRLDHLDSSSGQEDRFTSASWPSANNSASGIFGSSSEEDQTGGGTPGVSRKDLFGRIDHKTSSKNSVDDEKDVEEEAAAVKAREKERQEKERQEREAKEAEAREERERERARRYREKEREREKDRAAVQRVTLEARERAAAEARERAQRTAVERATAEARERAAQQAQERAARERAAVEKANAEARERAEQRAAVEKAARERAEQRAAVERAAAEARERAEKAAVERAQAEARERAERAAAERAAQEARQRAEQRAAVERAQQEARQRAAVEARERVEREKAEREAAEKAARERREHEQRKSEHDLDAFFSPGLHSTPSFSEPKRSASVNNMSSMGAEPAPVRRSMNNNSRPASVPSGDYLRSLLEDPVPQQTSNSGEDPSWNRKNGAADRSRERAKQALENIRKREAEMQREQAEKHRAADQLDAEIKRWAAGKEGNLRALLSTLQKLGTNSIRRNYFEVSTHSGANSPLHGSHRRSNANDDKIC
ncbi:hypothetical protein R1flu_004497 [Riccia fluitans]|uniref:Uncharacterized protein n=1 Tax=Riccia fluitans TaxID=41844 RepID=A0ABD1YQG9_9MARC